MSNQEIGWELINPEGVCKAESAKIAPRLTTLEGKTVGLYWNGKPGGKEALGEIANLLSQEVKDIKFIRYWEAVPDISVYTGAEFEQKIVQDMAALKPDVVICSQGD